MSKRNCCKPVRAFECSTKKGYTYCRFFESSAGTAHPDDYEARKTHCLHKNLGFCSNEKAHKNAVEESK